ncbi:hypothetical protein C3L33_09144, partial [Rhododendron williamsianum]
MRRRFLLFLVLVLWEREEYCSSDGGGQRLKITDAVVVAQILNATLVVPELDHHSFWKDDSHEDELLVMKMNYLTCSDFPNVFDVNWFISTLSKDVSYVTIVKRIPDKVMRSMEKPPYTMRVPRKSEPEYYLEQVLPILLRRRFTNITTLCVLLCLLTCLFSSLASE